MGYVHTTECRPAGRRDAPQQGQPRQRHARSWQELPVTPRTRTCRGQWGLERQSAPGLSGAHSHSCVLWDVSVKDTFSEPRPAARHTEMRGGCRRPWMPPEPTCGCRGRSAGSWARVVPAARPQPWFGGAQGDAPCPLPAAMAGDAKMGDSQWLREGPTPPPPLRPLSSLLLAGTRESPIRQPHPHLLTCFEIRLKAERGLFKKRCILGRLGGSGG